MGVIYLHGIADGKGSGGGGGTDDYNDLSNKPQVNGVSLAGNKTSDDLDLLGENDNLTPTQINDLLGLIDE